MQNIIKTNDVILISFVQSLLNNRGIACLIFDENISITEGSIGLFPRRIMVSDDDFSVAEKTLCNAGLKDELLSAGKN